MVSKSLRSKNFLFFPDASVTRKWGFKSHQMTWNYLPGQEQHYICSHKTDQLVLRRRLRVKSMLAWLMKLNAGRWMESSGWLLFELATKLLGIPKSQSILRFEQKSCSKTKAIVVGLPIFPIEFTCICSRFPLLRKQGGRKWMLWTKLANGLRLDCTFLVHISEASLQMELRIDGFEPNVWKKNEIHICKENQRSDV